MALPLAHRLKGQRVFDALYRRGRTLHGNALVLRWMPADAALLPPLLASHAASPWRCGVVVSSKVHKRAVQRNRLRRLLHQGLLSFLASGAAAGPGTSPDPLPVPLWMLISLKPGSATWESERLLGECRNLLVQAGLIS